MYRIFLVEDDLALAGAMTKQLESYGSEVCKACDFQNIKEEFATCDPHLVLMDIMLPFRDGYYWCGEIRKISSVPIVFISSASDGMNIVMAINMGGDDFIPKPVDAMVLNAKVQAILRRTYEISDNMQKIGFYGAVLHLSDHTVEYGEQRIELTKNEFRILQVLLENRGRIVGRDELMNRLWQSDLYVEENTLSVNVSRLRKKLEDCGLAEVIVTRPGSGYMIR
ncbi:MAG: response regulator transcription factor [Clostridia bacterium]|nr:response regulator transcription factor [Clostridia bacterium]